MLDTIGSGSLDKNQENQLISAFSGQTSGTYQQQLESKENFVDAQENVIEVIEDKSTFK